MRRHKGRAFDLLPQFFILPRDWAAFQHALAQHPKRLWIRKPLASSRGRGVSVLARPRKLPGACKPCIVQHYIRRPLLINGVKFDLRLYVAVTSFRPLRVYLYPGALRCAVPATFLVSTVIWSNRVADAEHGCIVFLPNLSLLLAVCLSARMLLVRSAAQLWSARRVWCRAD